MPNDCPEKSVILMVRALKAMAESSAMVAHTHILLGSGKTLLESSNRILSETTDPNIIEIHLNSIGSPEKGK